MKNKACVLWITMMLLSLVIQGKPLFGKQELFVDGWKFQLQKDNVISLSDDASRWREVTLPHDWSVEGRYSHTYASATGYLPGGLGWYAKSFTIPEDRKGEKVFIYFEGVYNRSKVYLNGHLLGERPNGYISFMYDLTPYLNYGSTKNDLRVEVDHTRSNDSRWYTGSGIYRDVYLVYANPVHVDLWGTYCITENVSAKKADFKVETTLRNESDSDAKVQVELSLYERSSGQLVATSKKGFGMSPSDSTVCIQKLRVKNPQMWSIENPELYKLVTTIYVNGEETESNELYTGVRTLTFDPNKGFFLNGKNTKLKGVCIHHDAGCLGAAVPREVWKRRLERLKDMGCNAIRMSHNPQAPDLYDLCDEMGFVVMDEAFDEWEFPKRKWVEGWNVGKPGYQGSADFFNEWCERDLRDMVLRDRNHPSIIMWSIGNEVDYPNDPYSHPVLETGTINQPVHGGYLKDNPPAERLSEISGRLAKTVRKYDLSRPVTAALAGVIMSNHTEYPGHLDICGYNYTENRYEEDHKTYPKRVIYGSETGRGINEWKAVRDNEYIFGQFIWTGFDYLGESGRYPSRGLNTGMIDFAGNLKTAGYLRRAMWSEKPVIYVGTSPMPRRGQRWRGEPNPIWNYNTGQRILVTAYSNTPYARLLVNGKQVGEKQAFNSDTYANTWEVEFTPGAICVEGLDDKGNIVATHQLYSTDRPAKIKAVADTTILDKKRGVAQIEIQITDKDGLPVYLADNEITCRVSGDARLLGMESGSNTDMSDNKFFRRRVHNGRLVAYIQASDGDTGKATVMFTSPWLEGANINLDIQ